MLSLSHTLISLPLGVYLTNPLQIFIAAFALHVLCDMVLHWNIYPHHYPTFPYKRVALDVVAGPLIAYFFLGQTLFSIPLWVAIAGGNMPDILHSLYFILKQRHRQSLVRWLNPFFYWHDRLQVETIDLVGGLTPQLTLAALSLVLVLTVSR